MGGTLRGKNRKRMRQNNTEKQSGPLLAACFNVRRRRENICGNFIGYKKILCDDKESPDIFNNS